MSGKKYQCLAWLICGIGAIFYCYEYFLRISPSVMTADLMRHYAISAAAFGNLIAFYYYAYTPMQLPVGVMMDRYGPRNLMALACLCCSIGAYLFVSSNVFYVAAIGRFLVGFGSAFAFVGALKLASIWLPPERFAFISGLCTTLGMLGAISGDIVLTKLVEIRGWHSTMLYAAHIGIILTIIIWVVVRNQKPGQQRDQQRHQDMHWNKTLQSLLVVIKTPQIWLTGLVGSLLYLPTSCFAELWGIPYFEQAHGFSHANAAQLISMIFWGWAVGGPLAGMLSDRLRLRRLPLTVGALIAGLIVTVILYMPGLSATTISVLLFIFGCFSGAEVIVFAIGRENCAKHLAGTAVAITNMLVMLSGAIFQPVVGILLDLHWSGSIASGLHVYSAADYTFALSILPIGLFTAAVLTYFIKETHASV